MIPKLLVTLVSGDLPGGGKLKANVLDPYKLLAGWDKAYDVSLPLAGAKVTDIRGWVAANTPNDRIVEIFRSYSYRTGMSFLDADINLIKMRIFRGHQTMGSDAFLQAIKKAAMGDLEGAKLISGIIQKTIAVWNYLNYGELHPYLDQARAQVATEMGYADKSIPELKGILADWKEFEPVFYNNIVSVSQQYMTNRIAAIAAKFPLGGPTGNDAVTKLLYESEELKKSISHIAFPLGK